jgi:hypothetical protein
VKSHDILKVKNTFVKSHVLHHGVHPLESCSLFVTIIIVHLVLYSIFRMNIKHECESHHRGHLPYLHHVASLQCCSEIQRHLTEKCGCWFGAVLKFLTACFKHNILRIGVWNQWLFWHLYATSCLLGSSASCMDIAIPLLSLHYCLVLSTQFLGQLCSFTNMPTRVWFAIECSTYTAAILDASTGVTEISPSHSCVWLGHANCVPCNVP